MSSGLWVGRIVSSASNKRLGRGAVGIWLGALDTEDAYVKDFLSRWKGVRSEVLEGLRVHDLDSRGTGKSC